MVHLAGAGPGDQRVRRGAGRHRACAAARHRRARTPLPAGGTQPTAGATGGPGSRARAAAGDRRLAAAPAYVIDRHWNLVAVNRAAEEVFGYGQIDHNCLVSFFTNARYRAAICHWEDAARQIVGQFRADAARYPDDPEFGRLAEDMCAVSAAFADIWAEHGIGSATQGIKVVDHPAVGELVFEYSSLPLADQPGHRLLLHVPKPGTGTEPRLAELLAEPAAS
ncbi:MmyB family transcriptional regulator [Saccharopolyspora elongata]|uniref:MmyB family transcriptional regulator n=1 Tax=Saccharopolyspora elongata TaxID=2530387 RepID=UPI0038B4EB12